MANLNDIKLSAQDILKKQFRSKVKGYDPDEVDAYLDQVISDYETFQQIVEDLYGQIGTLQRQLMDEKQKENKVSNSSEDEHVKTYTPTHRRTSSVASFALLITTIASNQRCWYVMYEDTLPEGHEKLKKSHF